MYFFQFCGKKASKNSRKNVVGGQGFQHIFHIYNNIISEKPIPKKQIKANINAHPSSVFSSITPIIKFP